MQPVHNGETGRRISALIEPSCCVTPTVNPAPGIHGIAANDLVLIWQSDVRGRRIFLDEAWLD